MSDLVSEDLSLPKATVQKLVAEILPSDLTISREARDALIECCVTFIMIISTESNEIAENEFKKTMSSEHVIKALENLGFNDYIPQLMKVDAEFKESLKTREKKVGKFQQSGMTEEELLLEQERLFASARQKMLSGAPESKPTE